MKTRLLSAFAAVAALLGLNGCTFPQSGRHIPASQVGQLQTTAVATIIRISDITIDGTKTNMGQYGGAVIGGAAAMPRGGVYGGGDALVVATASVAGAIAGQAVEEYVTRKQAQEITVQMGNGDVFVIVQESPPNYQVGDKVNVISGPAGARLDLAMTF